MRDSFLSVLFTSLLGCATIACAENESSVHQREVIDSLREAVQRQYPIEDMAAQLSDSLQHWADSVAPDAVASREELVDQLTRRMREWSGDQHFTFFHPEIPPPPLPKAAGRRRSCWADVEELQPGVWRLFGIERLAHPPEKTDCALEPLKNADVLILDLRECAGGSRESVRRILSWIFEEKTHYVTDQARDKKPKKSVTERVSRGNLGHATVIVLTSPSTASGCEAVSYFVAQHERGTIIGERTMGAAHAVRNVELARGFRMLMPTIRPVSPVSGTNWERSGVEPTLEVDAERALEAALEFLATGN